MRFLAELFVAFIKSLFFKSDAARASEAEIKNEILTAQEKAYFAMQQTDRPENKAELIDTLRDGKL